MLLSELGQKQKLLLVRYGTNIVDDCIGLHKQIIIDKNFCWFGKIGIAPAKASTEPVLEEKNPAIILYNRTGVFLCNLDDIVYSKPDGNYPIYYETELFGKYLYPKCYMKLSSIDEISIEDVAQFFVVSSGNNALDTLNHSMSSFLLIVNGQLSAEEKLKIQESKKKKTTDKKIKLAVNDCLYRINGRCTLKSCISYTFECERPNMCLKQKR